MAPAPWRCCSANPTCNHSLDKLTHSPHGQSVQQMFSQIAHRYNLMNRLMSAGQDLRWRKVALQAAGLRPGDTLLDVATGAGDLVFIARSLVPNLRVVAADFTVEMMRVGQGHNDARKQSAGNPPPAHWTAADTYALPFPSQYFDAVTSAFLLRNLADPLAGLREQARVLKPAGRLVMLDATPPPDNLLRPFINLHLNHFIPLLGKLISSRPDAYRYFPSSVAGFLRPQAIVALFQQVGLQKIYHRSFMFGAAALVVGAKPGN